jgi:hypothetical protein
MECSPFSCVGRFYPNISIQNARQVISSVTTDNAIGGQNTTTYKYGNAKVNVKGRGNLGFGWIEKKDLVFGDFTEDFIVTCGAYSNSADIAVVINIGLTGDNGDEW